MFVGVVNLHILLGNTMVMYVLAINMVILTCGKDQVQEVVFLQQSLTELHLHGMVVETLTLTPLSHLHTKGLVVM